MPARRRRPQDDSATRTALLDAAEALMLEDGYAAVTSRKIASRAGLPNAIHYYFEDMDDLFVELFRRGAARSLAQQEEALASPQPLWAFWDLLMDRSNGDLTTEFIALANHRKDIRSEIAESSRHLPPRAAGCAGRRGRDVPGGHRSPPEARSRASLLPRTPSTSTSDTPRSSSSSKTKSGKSRATDAAGGSPELGEFRHLTK